MKEKKGRSSVGQAKGTGCKHYGKLIAYDFGMEHADKNHPDGIFYGKVVSSKAAPSGEHIFQVYYDGDADHQELSEAEVIQAVSRYKAQSRVPR